MSLAGDSGNCMTVIDQVSWRQSMQAFVYCHGELVLNPLANWPPVKVAEHRSDGGCGGDYIKGKGNMLVGRVLANRADPVPASVR